ncbi:CHAT domain-containing protein [Prevotella pectinovora]|uniref:CHAT domain-containing protein n=1 Tax=Prevotella pectinovora TaxID=1602169 RepID=UPI00351FE7BF
MMNHKRYISVVFIWLLSISCIWAQTNPYRIGSPHYWMAQGTLDIHAGKFDIAYEHLEKAQKGYRELGDVGFQIQATEAMGALKAGLGEWEKAKQHYLNALQIATEANEDFAQSKVMVDLLALYRTVGDIIGYNQYLKALDSLYHVSNSAKLRTVYHLYWSNEYLARKEFAMVETQLLQCWDVMLDLPFSDREQAKLNYYNSMMNLKQQQRQYKDAIRAAKHYIEQTKILNGRNSDQQYQSYSKLCTLYALDNDSTRAFACLDSLERGVGHSYQDKEVIANFYNVKGCCYADFKKFDKAIACFDKAYNTLYDKRTEDSPSKFASLLNKSEAYFMLKRYDDAYATFSEYVETSRNKYGETSGTYSQALFTLANIEGARGNINEADSLFRMSMNCLLVNMKQLWRYSTPSQREQFWMETLNNLSGTAAFAIKCGNFDSELTETCYNALLFSKSLLLETEKSVVDIIRNEGTDEDIANYRNLLAINNRLLALRSNYEYNKLEIDSLTIRQRELEQRLSYKCQSYNEYETYLDINYEKVRNCLADNEVVIDFSDYQTEDSVRQYVAYIYDKSKRHPLLVKCFDQQQLDSLLDGMQSFTLYNYEQLQDGAFNLIWKSIGANITERSTVYYIPSGIMHSIALEALPLSDGTTLGQHYEFVRLTSAREIVKVHHSCKNNRTATLYGGLQYSLAPQKMEEESKAYEKSDLAALVRSEYGKSGFKDLRNTKDEVKKIEKTLEDNGVAVKAYSGSKGNAESFVALSGKSSSIVHIATHGFYYTPDEAKDKDFLRGYTDAMSLSGLVFAGGNAAWLGKKNVDGVLGGVLTAKDIANLDFKGTDLLVLSACKTGQGKVTAEGVFGLQRAFKKAGVGTIIMSLWNVDDKVTSEFMTTFYECLADKNNVWNKRKAFEEAKEIIRQKHPDPFHWAAFVMLD